MWELAGADEDSLARPWPPARAGSRSHGQAAVTGANSGVDLVASAELVGAATDTP